MKHRIEYSRDDSTGYELWNCRDCPRSGGVSPVGRGDTSPQDAAEGAHALAEGDELVHLPIDRCKPAEGHHVNPHRGGGCFLR